MSLAIATSVLPQPLPPQAPTPQRLRTPPPPSPPVVANGSGFGEFLTPEEFARLLKVSRANFFKLKSKGEVPRAAYFGRLPRWWQPEVEAWIGAGRPHADKWEEIKGRWLGTSTRGGGR